MGGGVLKGVIESVHFAAEGLRIPGLRLLRRVEGVPGDRGAGSGRPREAISEHFGVLVGAFRGLQGPFLEMVEPTRVTKDPSSMQLCYECFAKHFGTASDSGLLENVGRELLPDASDGSSTPADERTHLTFLLNGVGACGRRPSESADPLGSGVRVDVRTIGIRLQ